MASRATRTTSPPLARSPLFAQLILNPAAGRGRGAQMRAHVIDAVRRADILTALETSRPGDEELLSKQANEDGASVFVVEVGDGT
jgi:diacylglycerol kinase family enzyme